MAKKRGRPMKRIEIDVLAPLDITPAVGGGSVGGGSVGGGSPVNGPLAEAAPQEAAPQEAAPQEAAPQEAAPQEAMPADPAATAPDRSSPAAAPSRVPSSAPAPAAPAPAAPAPAAPAPAAPSSPAAPDPDRDGAGVAEIRARHHRIALLLARGEDPVDISRQVALSPTRIRQLAKSPAMQELVAFYRHRIEVELADIRQLLTQLSIESIEHLLRRLDAGEVTTRELISLAELALDRTGHGKTQTVNVRGLHLTLEDLQRLRQEEEQRIDLLD